MKLRTPRKSIRSPWCAKPTASKLAAVALLALLGCVSQLRTPADFTVALFGDLPYSRAQAHKLDEMIEQMNAEPLAFAVHVGDITSGSGPCTDEWLGERKRQFARIASPFVLLPGDNEWTDCHRSGFDPLERLARWRQLFCEPVALRTFRRQSGEHCENVLWEASGVVFVGVNVPGSNNNLGRTPQMDLEYAARMRAVFGWLEEAKTLAQERGALVVLMQADPFLAPREGPDGFASLRDWLRRAAQDASPRILLVHGDTHFFRDDEPLPRLRRVVVPGSPQVRWLRASAVRGEFRVEVADPP